MGPVDTDETPVEESVPETPSSDVPVEPESSEPQAPVEDSGTAQ